MWSHSDASNVCPIFAIFASPQFVIFVLWKSAERLLSSLTSSTKSNQNNINCKELNNFTRLYITARFSLLTNQILLVIQSSLACDFPMGSLGKGEALDVAHTRSNGVRQGHCYKINRFELENNEKIVDFMNLHLTGNSILGCGATKCRLYKMSLLNNPYVASTKKRDFALFLRLWRTFVEVIKLRGLFI